MNEKKMYKELLFYVEACESGSIFAGLLKAPNVKAVTASNPSESSWGWYCPPQDVVQGKEVGSCLGDEFSVRWMEDSDAADFSKETVGTQFKTVQKMTTKSHVMEYGVSTLDGEPIGHFEGDLGVAQPLAAERSEPMPPSGVNSRDAELRAAYFAMERAKTPEAREAAQRVFEAMLAARRSADERYLQVALLAVKGDEAKARSMLEGEITEIRDVACHRDAVFQAAKACGMDNYSMRHSRLFVNLCDEVPVAEINDAIQRACNAGLVV
eukprot:SRR837773.18513.p2 GENE.SRR837773.18513~~SRR837773.18513.p2  ORF type:complete len:275 (+),score=128.59 SRR837773.18513:24-827(+)